DVKCKCFVLVADVDSGHPDTLAHRTSSVSPDAITVEFRRRFSKTAILRLGRWAALTKQWGTSWSWWPAAFSRARSSLGLSPVTSRKMRPNVPRLFQPVWKAIWVIGR